MLYEVILLILSVVLLCSYGLLRDLYLFWRQQQRADALGRALAALEGQPAWEAEKKFGPPTEVLSGTTGRQLYIWKANALPGLPLGPSLVVLTLTVAPSGEITESHFEQRGKE
ncbi:MAG: hypothetical protein NW208_04485 [Bryobacter sp.]|nr:hypothetical protein [Bryobacter sp.]